jgi:hypothetical protein
MRYESAVNSAGGDDVALAKSFIIACEGPILNWYSLLQPHSVCSWVDLKKKFMQAFQMFHDTTAESSDLYNCKQKDREPLRNFVRRFMQQRSQIPEADDKTRIKALIKGLTPGKRKQEYYDQNIEITMYIKVDIHLHFLQILSVGLKC